METTEKIEIDAATIRWLKQKIEKPKVRSFAELTQFVEDTPEFWTDGVNSSYRKGFQDGFDHSIRLFEQMHTKGFSRTREIINILWEWSEEVLLRWVWNGKTGEGFPVPCFEHAAWYQIRSRILRRDGKCVRCGDVLKLEVDHIVEVQNGGRPVDENLRTLCAVCHKGKKLWANASSSQTTTS